MPVYLSIFALAQWVLSASWRPDLMLTAIVIVSFNSPWLSMQCTPEIRCSS
jgi:hypothetical protein